MRIAVATADVLTARMAGPAIRAWQIANALATEHEVRLVTSNGHDIESDRFSIETLAHDEFDALEEWCDVFVFQGWILAGRGLLQRTRKVIVADVYDPLHLEQLEQGRDDGEVARKHAVRNATAVLNEQLLRADYVICASEKQRDFWLGQLSALGRVNPATYDIDETMGGLVAVVPFGTDDHPPERVHAAIKGVIPGIEPDDQVILWGGGIYNWFDPLTLLRAIDRLRPTHPKVRLFFLGLKHPNPTVPEMRMAVAARQLSERLGLTDTFVFFNEGWVPYDDRQNYLLDADIGVSCHLDHIETEFSFRTRVLDYLWASLPVVTTGGDALGDLVESHGLGETVPPADVDALAAALARLLDDPEYAEACRQRIREIAPAFAWNEALRPLVEFCRHPHRAPDLVDPDLGPWLRNSLEASRYQVPATRRTLGSDIRLVVVYLRQGGPGLLFRRVAARIRRVAGRSTEDG